MTSVRDHRRDGYARKVETTPGYEIWESTTPDLGTKFKIEEWCQTTSLFCVATDSHMRQVNLFVYIQLLLETRILQS